MAWHDTKCPCGGRKETDTLICAKCVEHAQEDHSRAYDLRTFQDGKESIEHRRGAAVRLLAAARRRKPHQYQLL